MDDRPDGERPLDLAAARAVTRVRWLMLISGATTVIAIGAVIGVIGYRIYRFGGSAVPVAPPNVTALLPKGARVVSAAVAQDRIVVTIDLGGATEIRTYDLISLQPTGRLRFSTEP
jgi:hypothetical protein